MSCEVIRPFDGPTGRLSAGEVIDVAGWKWAQQLIDQGYLRAVSTPTPSGRGEGRRG